MQRAQDRPTELVPEPPSPRPGLSPAVAFSMLAILVAVIAAAVFLTRPKTEVQAAATNPTSTSPNFALTNEEAIARFKELQSLHLEMYEKADPSLIEEVFTPDAVIIDRVRRELRRLVRDQVTARFTYSDSRRTVLSNTSESIRIRQEATVDSRFLDSDGNDVTRGGRREHQTIDWTMHLVGSQWLLYDAVIIKAEPVRK